MKLNESKLKEFVILISGPIFQFIAYLILLNLIPKMHQSISAYHYGILFFNLLPIYPLDGGKLINLLFNNIFPYKKSIKISVLISYITVIIFYLLNKSFKINILFTISFLIFIITKEYKKINYLYNKFLLERYLNNFKFKKSKIVNNIDNLYRDRSHLIKKDGKYHLEREILEKMYKI